MKKRLLCLLLLLSLNVSVYASDTLSVKQMHEDVDFYFSTLKEIHPNLYAWATPAQFDSTRLAIKDICGMPMPRSQFLFKVGLVNKLTEEHTFVDGFSQQQNIRTIDSLDVVNGKLYYNNTELTSIGGIPTLELFWQIDGLTTHACNRADYLAFIRRVLPDVLAIHGQKGQTYKAIGKSNDREFLIEINCSVYAFDSQYARRFIPYVDFANHADDISTQIFKDESIGVLYYNTSAPDSEKEFRRITEKFFTTVAKEGIENIIIDVSMNSGGNDMMHEYILKYLNSEPYEIKGRAYATNPGVSYLASKYKGKQYESYINQLKEVAAAGSKEFSEIYEGRKSSFKGKVFVLMGPQTYSSAYAFCETIKRGKYGTLVGEAAGQRAPFAGTVLNFTLPNSKLDFSCAAYYFTSEPIITDSEGFLQPDIPYILDHQLGIEDYKKIVCR